MASVKTVRLGFHKASGQHTKWVGKSWTADGRLVAYCFYLGTDPEKAVAVALDLARQWADLTAKGEAAWSADFLARFNGKVDASALSAPLTIGQAKEKYFAHLRQRNEGGQITDRYFRDEQWRLGKALGFLDVKRPMKSLDEAAISKAVLAIVARPNDWGVLYCQQISKSLKWFLNWSHDASHWDKPRNYDRIFKNNTPRHTLQEQADALKSPEAEYLTVEELRLLWSGCVTPLDKAVFLLGLNAAFSTSELSSLRHAEIRWGSHEGATYLERLRQKSGVYAKYKLWTETADALKSAIASKGDLALLYRGHPLIEGVTDSARVVWRAIRQRSGVDKPHKLLRKTAARMAKQIGGLEISEMILAHSEGGMNKHYSGRNWEALDKATDAMRTQLESMFNGASCALKLTAAA